MNEIELNIRKNNHDDDQYFRKNDSDEQIKG